MRYAAVLFNKLLGRFPRFETAADLLVFIIGAKLLIDYFGNNLLAAPGAHPVDFHSPTHFWFWAFWVAMAISFAVKFMRASRRGTFKSFRADHLGLSRRALGR